MLWFSNYLKGLLWSLFLISEDWSAQFCTMHTITQTALLKLNLKEIKKKILTGLGTYGNKFLPELAADNRAWISLITEKEILQLI